MIAAAPSAGAATGDPASQAAGNAAVAPAAASGPKGPSAPAVEAVGGASQSPAPTHDAPAGIGTILALAVNAANQGPPTAVAPKQEPGSAGQAAVAGQGIPQVASLGQRNGRDVGAGDPGATRSVGVVSGPGSAGEAGDSGTAESAGGVLTDQADPREADWLAESLPIDPGRIGGAIQEYLDNLDDVGGVLADLLASDAVQPWLTGAAVLAAASVVARRLARSTEEEALNLAGDGGFSWVLGSRSDSI